MVHKRKSRRKVSSKPRSRPVPKPARAKRSNAPNVDPFVACVYGPVSSAGEMDGCPDGSTLPSIMVEHRQTVVLRPSRVSLQQGAERRDVITFALVSSPFGAVGLGDCEAEVTANCVDWETTQNTAEGPRFVNPIRIYGAETRSVRANFRPNQLLGTNDDEDPHTDIGCWYRTVPFVESLVPNGTQAHRLAEAGLKFSKFRVITTTATVDFTGSSLSNAGVATTARINLPQSDDKEIMWGDDIIDAADNEEVNNPHSLGRPFMEYGVELLQRPPTSFGDVAQLAGGRTFPARESVQLINPPSDFSYHNANKLWVPFYTYNSGAFERFELTADQEAPNYIPVFAGLAHRLVAPTNDAEDQNRFIPIAGLGCAPTTFYAAQGLTQDASLTVTVRTCVEYTLAYDAPTARFAKLPPPERPLAIKQVHAIGRVLPSSQPLTARSERVGWLENAWNWYKGTMGTIIGKSWDLAGKLTGGYLSGGDAGAAAAGLNWITGGMSRLDVRGRRAPNAVARF